MTGKINAWHLGDRRSRPAPRAKGAVAERELSTYLVWRNKKAPLHVRKSAYTNSMWAYVWHEWTDTKAKDTNISRGFVLSLPGGGFEPKTSVSWSAKSTTRPRKPYGRMVEVLIEEPPRKAVLLNIASGARQRTAHSQPTILWSVACSRRTAAPRTGWSSPSTP